MSKRRNPIPPPAARRGRPATPAKRRAAPADRHPAARQRHPARGRRVKDFRQGAQSRLRRFRQGSALAVALTALLLMIWLGDQQALADAPDPPLPTDDPLRFPDDPAASLEQATRTVRDLLTGFVGMLPRLLIAIVLILLAIWIGKGLRAILERSLGSWERTHALSALVRIAIFLLGVAAALSVLAGDARALIGSIGLVGLALSWALQTPIESFTGWLMNSFRIYYRVGDRIEVGEVFGDVYKIDVLTTTVWEAGGPGKPVAGAQSTGAMITFPNWEVLRSNIINYSRDFPYVWDEVTISLANESDIAYSVAVFERVAREVFGSQMEEPARDYHELLARARLAFDVEDEPKAFVSFAESWVDCTIRYLVPVRARRRWASELTAALARETAKPEHRGKLIDGYPRQEMRVERGWNGMES